MFLAPILSWMAVCWQRSEAKSQNFRPRWAAPTPVGTCRLRRWVAICFLRRSLMPGSQTADRDTQVAQELNHVSLSSEKKGGAACGKKQSSGR